HFAEENFNFRKHTLRHRHASDGKRCRVRRMAMHNSVNVRPVLVDGEVQQDFTGALSRACELLSFVVHLAHVLAFHEALAYHRRRTKDFTIIPPYADITVVSRCETPRVNAPADLADLFLQSVFVDHDWFTVK